MYMYVLSICKSIYINIYNYTSSRSLIPLPTFISSPYFHMHPLHHPRLIPNWPTSASLFLACDPIRSGNNSSKNPRWKPATVSQDGLVGGFKPSEKYKSNWKSSLTRGENKKCLKPPPGFVFLENNLGKDIFDDKLLGIIWHDSTNIFARLFFRKTLWKKTIESCKHTKATYEKTTSCGNAQFASILPNIALRTRVFSCSFLTGPSRIFFWGCRVILDPGFLEISSNSCDILYWYPYCYSAPNHQKRLISSTQVVKAPALFSWVDIVGFRTTFQALDFKDISGRCKKFGC